jgi:hypothetical protein
VILNGVRVNAITIPSDTDKWFAAVSAAAVAAANARKMDRRFIISSLQYKCCGASLTNPQLPNGLRRRDLPGKVITLILMTFNASINREAKRFQPFAEPH